MTDDPARGERTQTDWRQTIGRAARIGLALLALLVGGITVTAWWLGDQSNLPFDYEGFD
ncbi:MAG: hypothetical protein QNK03_14945 [Myxococcota bacterium]|nr:hypothetical protein [Myxococcota bacterium]